MINSLRQLRIRFEKALLAWLNSSLQAPMAVEKRQAVETLNACVQQLRHSEPDEPYWLHCQAILHDLLQNRLVDQTNCRKVFAQINLLLAQKIQNRHVVTAQLWYETVKLQIIGEGGGDFVPVNDAFLQEAEHWLSQLKEINARKKIILSTPAELATALESVRGMRDLARKAQFGLLLKLGVALENLLVVLQKKPTLPWTPQENTALNNVLQSMHRLLHQAAAGITPKYDESFLQALWVCEQATSMRAHS